MLSLMNILLTAVDPSLHDARSRFGGDVEGVTVHHYTTKLRRLQRERA